jgi:maleylacetoacetate isomerase
MNDIIFFDYWRSSASYRVRIALNLKGVAYKTVHTSLLDGDHKAAVLYRRSRLMAMT